MITLQPGTYQFIPFSGQPIELSYTEPAQIDDSYLNADFECITQINWPNRPNETVWRNPQASRTIQPTLTASTPHGEITDYTTASWSNPAWTDSPKLYYNLDYVKEVFNNLSPKDKPALIAWLLSENPPLKNLPIGSGGNL